MTGWAEGRVSVPWRPGTSARWWVAQMVVAGVVIAAAWAAGGRGSVQGQIPWLNVAVLAAVVSAVANGLWIVSARRAFGARRRLVLGALDVTVHDGLDANPSPAGTPGEESPVAVPGLQRYHRPGCPLVAGRTLVAATGPDHDAAGRVPCGWCTP